MAKRKKTRHTQLVVPGQSASAQKGAKGKKPAPPQDAPLAQNTPAQAAGGQNAGRAVPSNTVQLPRVNPRIVEMRKKKRRQRMQVLAMLLAFLFILLMFFTGAYRTVVLKGGELVESARIALQPGSGFPVEFEMPGYIESAAMGNNAVAVLGEKDMAIVSASGKELYRVQHNYANPHISAGGTRLCLYNRGGYEYVVDGRDSRVITRTTEQEILFAEVSPGGSLALVTSSRFRATLEVFTAATDDEPQLSWQIVDEKPYSAAFLADNKNLALACLTTKGGTLDTTIYLLHVNRDTTLAEIRVGSSTVLQMEYVSGDKLLVVFDTHAALYNSKGVETARYNYTAGDLKTAHLTGGRTALVFQSPGGNRLTAVALDTSLTETGRASLVSADTPDVLVTDKGFFLLAGSSVHAYTLDGQPKHSFTLDSAGYALQYAGQPLLVSSGQVESLTWMLQAEGTRQSLQAMEAQRQQEQAEREAAASATGSTTGDGSAPQEDTSVSGQADTSLPQDEPETKPDE